MLLNRSANTIAAWRHSAEIHVRWGLESSIKNEQLLLNTARRPNDAYAIAALLSIPNEQGGGALASAEEITRTGPWTKQV